MEKSKLQKGYFIPTDSSLCWATNLLSNNCHIYCDQEQDELGPCVPRKGAWNFYAVIKKKQKI